MKWNSFLLAGGVMVAVVVAGSALAQRGHAPAKEPGAQWSGAAGGGWGRMGPMGMRGGRDGAGRDGGGRQRGRLLGPEGRLLHDPGRLADDLKLTTQQREKLRDIGEGLARQFVRSRADLEIAHLDLARDLRSDSANRSEIENQVDAISKLQGNLMKTAVMARLDVRGVLTTDQRRDLMDMRFHGEPMRGGERRPEDGKDRRPASGSKP